jgi:hypothetical protein
MTVPDGPIESDFYIHKMKNQDVFYNTVKNEHGSTAGGSTVIIRWKTNLKSNSFFLYNETTDEIMLDNAGVKTNDGYAFSVSEKKPGAYKYSVAVSGEENDYRIEKTKYTLPFAVIFEDYKTAENQALKDLISRSGAASKNTVREKLDTLAYYMANTEWNKGGFIHPGDARPGEYADTHGDYGVWFQSRVINCVKATAIIEKCALIFGVSDNGISEEYPYPADSPYAHHVRPVITYNGETFWVDGSPLTDIR